MKGGKQGDKGRFGRAGLPLAGGGLAVAVLLVALFGGDYLGRGSLLSSGPLSSSHATFEQSCDSCHSPGESAADRNCAACHERFGGSLGVYSFASHYLYGGRELARLEARPDERPCRDCHGEHFGRDATITRVPDTLCTGCHPFASFVRQHPEFDFAAERLPDSDALRFPHIHHLRELLGREGAGQLEQTCLRCHQPRPDGRGFEPIRFDRHCRDCHLPPTNPTPRLPLAGSLPGGLGVEPIESIRRAEPLGGSWVEAMSADSFRLVPGGRLVKRPVLHADPWILHNLRRLRRRLYEPGPLADLLAATPAAEAAGGDLGAVYGEAMASLEALMAELGRRPQPELQGDLLALRQALARLRQRVRDPTTRLGSEAFAIRGDGAGGELGDAGEELVAGLTLLCERCHAVRRATIERVQADQRALHRAEFDHRAHVLQRGCLDCHDRIPIAERLADRDPVPPEVDGAAIQNLPSIATCRECHGAGGTASSCVDCHLFHPDKQRHGQLLVAAR